MASRTATCPLCRDYEGEPESVEAHISAKTDPTHRGETGSNHREEIEDPEEEAQEADGPESVSQTEPAPEPEWVSRSDTEREPEAAEVPPDQEEPDFEVPFAGEDAPDQPEAEGAEADAEARDGSADGQGGGALSLVLLVGLGLLAWRRADGGSSSTSDPIPGV